MSFLVRKINAVKWRQPEFLKIDKIPADAITSGCLKTEGNNLSVWRIDSKDSLEEAVIAIVSSGRHIKTMDFVILDSELLTQSGISVVSREMDTPYEAQKRNHLELAELSYTEIGIIARQILNEIKIEGDKRYVEGELVDMLSKAAREGKLQKDLLDENIRNRLTSDSSAE
jgi:hypothetical protein